MRRASRSNGSRARLDARGPEGLGGGHGRARTLWRWGNACPLDEEPFGEVTFTALRQPNAFGLTIAHNPYEWEYITEPRQMRGGDGGDALCGGHGNLASWLGCAPAFLWSMFDEDSYLEEGFVRRAFELR
jgi:hypothetical protein